MANQISRLFSGFQVNWFWNCVCHFHLIVWSRKRGLKQRKGWDFCGEEFRTNRNCVGSEVAEGFEYCAESQRATSGPRQRNTRPCNRARCGGSPRDCSRVFCDRSSYCTPVRSRCLSSSSAFVPWNAQRQYVYNNHQLHYIFMTHFCPIYDRARLCIIVHNFASQCVGPAPAPRQFFPRRGLFSFLFHSA